MNSNTLDSGIQNILLLNAIENLLSEVRKVEQYFKILLYKKMAKRIKRIKFDNIKSHTMPQSNISQPLLAITQFGDPSTEAKRQDFDKKQQNTR